MANIFQTTARPAEELFFSRKDSNDPRLGELVGRREDQYKSADVVILGCPQDEGVRRNRGREGAALAPTAIRKQFYKLTPFNIKKKLFDLGDVRIEASLEETHDTHFDIARQVLEDGKRLIVLGGGND